MAQIEETILSVPAVDCEHCAHTIDTALGNLAGVEAVSTDIPSKSVRLRYDPGAVSMQQIESTLDEAGYTVAK